MPTKPVSPKRYVYPVPPPNLQDDIGRPPFGVGETTRKPRTFFGTSGRAQAWQGALDLGRERPLLGFGFGTEDHVFVDRYADFNSNVPENSYIGLFLDLGVVGVVAFVGFVLALVGFGVMRLRSLDPQRRLLVAACSGAVAGGLVLAAFQSYLYAVGNNATAAFWLCAFLFAALAPVALPRARFAVAGCAALVAVALLGVLERSHRGRTESAVMSGVVREVGPLDSPRLDSYRYLSVGMQCLLYRRGRDPFALELCVDPAGRVIETIDRRTAPKPRIHSLRDDPARSTVRVDREEVTRLLHEFGIPFRYLPATT